MKNVVSVSVLYPQQIYSACRNESAVVSQYDGNNHDDDSGDDDDDHGVGGGGDDDDDDDSRYF